MKTKSLTSELAMIALLFLPFIYMGLIWPQLPATIPGHYGANGQPDRYDPKSQLAIVFGVMTVFLYVIFRLAPRFDARANLHSALYQKIRWAVMLFWVVFMGWFWTISWRGIGPGTLQTSVLVGVGLLLAVLGNLMNSLKPNYAVGIRTPWTLDSETVWRKTHHLGSRLLAGTGLLVVLVALIVPGPYVLPVALALILLSALVPIVYSYVYFRREKSGQMG